MDEIVPSGSETVRALESHFRPEFLNRIDRVVVFSPLSLEVAERITRREIDLVLDRSGITRRHIVVDVDDDVIDLVLEEGYSSAYGARPLKRTVERHLLLPVARSIATHRAGPESVAAYPTRRGSGRRPGRRRARAFRHRAVAKP